jgi:hypothetical protein
MTSDRDTTRSQAFTYDQVNRVLTAQTPAPCGTNCWSQAFTYDQWANLQAVAATGTAPPLASLGVNTSNRITLGGWRTLPRSTCLTLLRAGGPPFHTSDSRP